MCVPCSFILTVREANRQGFRGVKDDNILLQVKVGMACEVELTLTHQLHTGVQPVCQDQLASRCHS